MRWNALLAAAVIFLAGIATGALGMRALSPALVIKPAGNSPLPVSPDRRRSYLERLDREVDLTPEQRAQIEQIIAGSQDRLRALWEPVAPQAREEYRHVRREIAALLTPEQKTALEESRQKRRERNERREETPPSQENP